MVQRSLKFGDSDIVGLEQKSPKLLLSDYLIEPPHP